MIELRVVRRLTGLTQVELAANLGVGQAQVSKIERQTDMLLSTLAAYLEALGVHAELLIEVKGQSLTFSVTSAGKAR